MKKDANNDILSRNDRRDGMTVPEGYFADFADRIDAMLPERPELYESTSAVISAPQSLWQRLRPYTYMAAMFAGVWCMLKMFTLMSDTATLTPIDKNPVIAEAFSNDAFVNDYVISDLSNLSNYDIYDDMMANGIDAQALCDSLDILIQDITQEY